MDIHANIETAIQMFYGKYMLDSKDISEMFGGISKTSITKLKNKARVKMIEKNVPIIDNRHVDTNAAFEAWGLDITDLERRYKKMKEFRGG